MQKLIELYKNQGFQILSSLFTFLIKKSYIAIIISLVGAVLVFVYVRKKPNQYIATVSFVLSTEGREGGGFSSVFSQFGIDNGLSGADNIFTGENIIELFKSRKLVDRAMFANIKSENKSLLNLIASNDAQLSTNPKVYPFPGSKYKFNSSQQKEYNRILAYVVNSFMVSKRNKLVFYYISAKSTNQKEAYYIAKNILEQTAKYFIDTKTQTAQNSLKLLLKETDSLGAVLRNLYQSSASVNDRTYNINPSLMVQRSGAFFNQAKAIALGSAYAEVMRNLELAKINLQKVTPLYRIIDEPELPLMAESKPTLKYALLSFFFFLFLILFFMSIIKITIITKNKL